MMEAGTETMAGEGTLLGAAAGDAIARRAVQNPADPNRPVESLRTLARVAHQLVVHGQYTPEPPDPVDVAQAPVLDLRDGHPVSMQLCAMAVPLALRHRSDAGALVDALEGISVRAAAGPESVAAALAVGGAVAACSHGQRHLDLWLAALDTVAMSGPARQSQLWSAMENGWTRFDQAGHVSLLSVAPVRAVLHTAKLGAADDPAGADGMVRDAATSSAQFGFFVGALVGARFGIRSWGWPVPHAAWYAEVGRLLSAGQTTSTLEDPLNRWWGATNR